jgi:hypothetical protein
MTQIQFTTLYPNDSQRAGNIAAAIWPTFDGCNLGFPMLKARAPQRPKGK